MIVHYENFNDFGVLSASIAELTDNSLDYAGERSEFIKVISLVSALDYDDSTTFSELLSSFAKIVRLTCPVFHN